MPNASEYLGGQTAQPAGGVGGGGMASPAQDLSELLYRGQNVLGKSTEVSLPGTVAQPLSAGIASTPTPASVPGAGPEATEAVAGMGAEGGFGGGEGGGPSILQLIQQALGLGGRAGDLAKRLAGAGGDNAALNEQVRGMLAGGLQPFTVPSDVVSGASGGSAGAFDLSGATPFNATEGLASQEGINLGTGIGAGGGGAVPGGGASPWQSGLGLGSAGLSLIGSLTGDTGIGKAAGVLGGLGTIASVAPYITGAATAPALTSLSALSANPYTAMVAAAIMQAMDLYNSIEQGYSPEHTILKGLVAPVPVVNTLAGPEIDKAFLPSADWMKFPGKAVETMGQAGTSLAALFQGLPTVQSKAELADAIQAYKTEIARRVGGYGEGSGPYELPGLPEVGARTHGMPTPELSLAGPLGNLQQTINALLPLLPETAPSSENATLRNFAQYTNRGQSAPPQVFYDPATWDPRATFGTATPMVGGQMMVPGEPGQADTHVKYGQPGYNYALSGYPEPGQFIGSPSAAWQQLIGGQPSAAPAAAAPAPAAAPGGPGGAVGTEIDELIRQAAARQ